MEKVPGFYGFKKSFWTHAQVDVYYTLDLC